MHLCGTSYGRRMDGWMDGRKEGKNNCSSATCVCVCVRLSWCAARDNKQASELAGSFSEASRSNRQTCKAMRCEMKSAKCASSLTCYCIELDSDKTDISRDVSQVSRGKNQILLNLINKNYQANNCCLNFRQIVV